MNTTVVVTGQSRSWQSRWFHFVLWAVILMALGVFLRAVEPILLPFVLGMLVAYLMDPIVGAMQRMKVSRTVSAGIVTFSLFAIITALIIWLAPILYNQLITMLQRAPAQLHTLENGMREHLAPLLKSLNGLTGGDEPSAIPSDSGQIVERGLTGMGLVAGKLFSSGAALINVMALLLITPIVCFYLIRDWPSLVRKVDGLLPLAYAPDIREQMYLINRTLAAYVRGQLVVMLLMSIFYVAGLALTGINFSLVLGLLAGCIIVVPYVGSIISVGLGLLIANSQFGGTDHFWWVIAVYGIGQILESQILTPKIIGDRVGLHPLWMLFGMLAGAVLLGLVGVLLAVPLTAVIGVLVKFAVRRYLNSGLYHA